MTKREEWRAIPDHPGYEASSLGRLRSIDRIVSDKNGRPMRYRGTLLRISKSKNRRYQTVHLGEGHSANLHTIICRVFHGPPPTPKHEVAHWNNNGHDNRETNLRWATILENRDDQHRHRTRMNGSKNHKAILSEADVYAIRALHATKRMSQQFIADLFKVSRPTITLIINGTNWNHLR
jgi:hypothetical protein